MRSRTARHRAALSVVAAGVSVGVSMGGSGAGAGDAPTSQRVVQVPPRPALVTGSIGSGDAVVVGRPYAGAARTPVLARSRPVSRDTARQALAEATGGPVQAPRSGQDRQRDGALADLAARAEQEAASLARAWVLPLARGYRLTAGFGECSSLWARCHTGLDFAAPSGTPVRAAAPGTITEVGWAGAYGNRTVQTLEDGTELWYCHLESIGVRLGAEVTAGQEIGRVGSTGNSTGPHLHLEVRPGAGDPVDPAAALTAHGVSP